MKYTLFAFQLHESELVDDLRQRPTEIGRLLAEWSAHRVDICAGVYVFETQKGWRNMHHLRAYLTGKKMTFVELPFEQALAGFFPDAICDKLLELGKSSGSEISLLNLNIT
jgi:hypothetical protein